LVPNENEEQSLQCSILYAAKFQSIMLAELQKATLGVQTRLEAQVTMVFRLQLARKSVDYTREEASRQLCFPRSRDEAEASLVVEGASL
jgi:hypothetical protein